MTNDTSIAPLLERIAAALERLSPPPFIHSLDTADAYIWHAEPPRLEAVHRVARVDVGLLQGIESQRDILLRNTRHFARGWPANNALLWGARGTGKSSLVKAVHAAVNAEQPGALVLVEIHREDIATLGTLLAALRDSPRRALLFCDDLSFEATDQSYKALKTLLEGGIEGRPDNVLFYATSNRRHLMARSMIENEQSTAIHASEAVEEKVSLSDRFGLWLGFHNLDQATYLAIVDGYVQHYHLTMEPAALRHQALEWAVTRGTRTGRVAWQFIQDLAGRLGRPLE